MDPQEAHVGGIHHAVATDWHGCAYYGVAGTDAAKIELSVSAGVAAMPLESPFGAFVVAFDGDQSATVRIKNRFGAVLMSKDSEGHRFGRRQDQ